MPVTTTAQAIIVAALATSPKNRPEYLATNATELLDVLTRAQRGWYAVAALVNPQFYGDEVDVPYVASGWARPEDAQSVFRIEDADGDEVFIVPFEDRGIQPYDPVVYPLGQVYRSRGNAPDPADPDPLTMFYSRRPDAFAAVGDLLDSQWAEAYNTGLIADIAMYLARKDGRTPDVESQRAIRDSVLAAYVAFLRTESVGMVRRDLQRDTMPALSDLTPMLIGGQ